MKRSILFGLTSLHLLVDGLCACCVFMMTPLLGAKLAMVMFWIYNMLAFLTQPFTGWRLDKTQDKSKYLLAALGLLLTGALLTSLSAFVARGGIPGCFFSINHSTLGLRTLSYLAVCLIGIGNSIFHVYGGKQVASDSGNDMRHLGIFVSTGAIGLVIGQHCASFLCLGLIALFTTLATWGVLREKRKEVSIAEEEAGLSIMTGETENHLAQNERTRASQVDKVGLFHDYSMKGNAIWMLLFVLLIVFGRSFIGRLTPSGVGTSTLFAIMLGVLAFAGKSLGGFVAHRFGLWSTLTMSLIIAGLCFMLGGSQHPDYTLAMVLMINLTMPITLHLANHCLPDREGLAFGLLAFTLFPGFILGGVSAHSPLAFHLLYALVPTMIIEALVLLAIRERRWQVLAMSVTMNILTNLPLNLLVVALPFIYHSIPSQLMLELIVAVIESVLYWMVVRQWRQALTYSLLCNATSYLTGLLFTLIM